MQQVGAVAGLRIVLDLCSKRAREADEKFRVIRDGAHAFQQQEAVGIIQRPGEFVRGCFHGTDKRCAILDCDDAAKTCACQRLDFMSIGSAHALNPSASSVLPANRRRQR